MKEREPAVFEVRLPNVSDSIERALADFNASLRTNGVRVATSVLPAGVLSALRGEGRSGAGPDHGRLRLSDDAPSWREVAVNWAETLGVTLVSPGRSLTFTRLSGSEFYGALASGWVAEFRDPDLPQSVRQIAESLAQMVVGRVTVVVWVALGSGLAPAPRWTTDHRILAVLDGERRVRLMGRRDDIYAGSVIDLSMDRGALVHIDTGTTCVLSGLESWSVSVEFQIAEMPQSFSPREEAAWRLSLDATRGARGGREAPLVGGAVVRDRTRSARQLVLRGRIVGEFHSSGSLSMLDETVASFVAACSG